MRIAALQYEFCSLSGFDEFSKKITSIVNRASKKGVEFLCLPEYLGYHLELMEKKGELEQFLELFQRLAKQNNLFIQAGTILARAHSELVNRAYLFFPNGLFDWQDKMQLTPAEKKYGIQPGNKMKLFDSSWGPFSIAICYDIEFPHLTKEVVRQGAKFLIVPSCTETLAGYYRVAISSRARAIENQCFVIHSCTVGKGSKDWIEESFGKAGIYCPCDGNFPANGILSEGRLNKPATIFSDVNIDDLLEVRTNGSVRNYQDYSLS